MEKILITGALGQIGTELTQRLVNLFGKENVIALDIKDNPTTSAGFYEKVDIANTELISQIIDKYQITIVYHLASLLSGTSEKNPQLAWKLNIEPLLYFLELEKSTNYFGQVLSLSLGKEFLNTMWDKKSY